MTGRPAALIVAACLLTACAARPDDPAVGPAQGAPAATGAARDLFVRAGSAGLLRGLALYRTVPAAARLGVALGAGGAQLRSGCRPAAPCPSGQLLLRVFSTDLPLLGERPDPAVRAGGRIAAAGGLPAAECFRVPAPPGPGAAGDPGLYCLASDGLPVRLVLAGGGFALVTPPGA